LEDNEPKKGKGGWLGDSRLTVTTIAAYAGIIVIIGIIVSFALVSFNSGSYQLNPSISSPSTSAPTSEDKIVCGKDLQGITLFGSWRWSGSSSGTPQQGLFTFESDCTFTNKPISGISTGPDSGSFLVSDNPPSITLKNEVSGRETQLSITEISENPFHASSLDNAVNLDFVKAP
jgi:hypothetical protein